MKTQDFDFFLPSELIAQFPTEQRTASRLLYVDSNLQDWQDDVFIHLPNYLRRGDVMVFNDTHVIKARLFGKKDTGGSVEVMVERVLDNHHVLAAIRASHAPKPNSQLLLADSITTTVVTRNQEFYLLTSIEQQRLQMRLVTKLCMRKIRELSQPPRRVCILMLK